MRSIKISCLFTLLSSLLIISCGEDSSPTTENTPTYKISTSVTPDGGGEISISPEGTVHEEGTEITLTPNPSEEYVFSQWNGDYNSSENPLTFTLNEDISVTAVFEKKTYTLNITKEGEGTVTERVIQEKDYEHGTTVELTAEPSEYWRFVEWGGVI